MPTKESLTGSSEKYEHVEIRRTANGFILFTSYGHESPRIGGNDVFCFESFESLSAWLRKNFR